MKPSNVSRESKQTAKRLQKRRKETGRTQTFIAEKLNIAQEYLSRLENGKHEWTPELVQKYEEALA